MSLDVRTQEEQKLIFERFDTAVQWEIGAMFANRIQSQALPVAVQIRINGKQVFYFSGHGATSDQWSWIRRKSNVTERFECSSMHFKEKLEAKGKGLSDYNLEAGDYAPYGGSFPVTVKGVGTIGAITVSGLSQMEDHELIVSVLSAYMGA